MTQQEQFHYRVGLAFGFVIGASFMFTLLTWMGR